VFAAVHRDRLLAAVACVLLACGGPGPESNSAPDEDCNLVGCSDVVTAEIDVPVVSAHLLTGTRLEVCRNGSCAHSTLRLESNDLLLCRGAGGGAYAGCDPRVEISPSSVRIQVQYRPAFDEPLLDGDEFTVRILDASASITIAERSGTVASYETSYPNGPTCGPECKQGTF